MYCFYLINLLICFFFRTQQIHNFAHHSYPVSTSRHPCTFLINLHLATRALSLFLLIFSVFRSELLLSIIPYPRASTEQSIRTIYVVLQRLECFRFQYMPHPHVHSQFPQRICLLHPVRVQLTIVLLFQIVLATHPQTFLCTLI